MFIIKISNYIYVELIKISESMISYKKQNFGLTMSA